MGNVYLMYDEGNGFCKIGVTNGLAEDRLKELQTGNGNKLHVIHVYQTKEPFKIEHFLHTHFRLKHEMGEWFRLDYDDMVGFIDTCKWAQNIVDSLEDNPFYNRR